MSSAGEQSDVIRAAVAALNELSIPYAIGGSIASSTYGTPRFTHDADITEDVVLLKLQWYQLGGEVSDRQWSDVLGVLQARRESLDRDYLEPSAMDLGVSDLLERATKEAGG
jgi:hypothetical protein